MCTCHTAKIKHEHFLRENFPIYSTCHKSTNDEEIVSALPALSSTGVGMLPVVLVPTVLVIIVALLCGITCVVYQLNKEEKYVTSSLSYCYLMML